LYNIVDTPGGFNLVSKLGVFVRALKVLLGEISPFLMV